MKPHYERIIKDWMLSVTKGNGIDRYDDLHIDTINPLWKSKDKWIEGGIDAFEMAVRLRDELDFDVTVALAFSMTTGKGAIGVDFTDQAELAAKLNWSPPSLYLFRKDQESWAALRQVEINPVTGDVLVQDLGRELFPSSASAKGFYYIEFKQKDTGEYSRTVFVAG